MERGTRLKISSSSSWDCSFSSPTSTSPHGEGVPGGHCWNDAQHPWPWWRPQNVEPPSAPSLPTRFFDGRWRSPPTTSCPSVQELQAKPIQRPLGEQWAPGCKDLHFNFYSFRLFLLEKPSVTFLASLTFSTYFSSTGTSCTGFTQSSSSAPCWSAPPPYWRTWPVWQVWIYIVVLFHLLIIILISGSAVTADKWAVSTPVWVKVKVKSCKI